MNFVEKMKKKMTSRENENTRIVELEESLKNITESFEKSEMIRKE